MTRTFIALEMDADLQRHLAEIIRQVAQALPGIHWVDPAGIHLTLAFLGELDDERLAAAMEAAEQATRQIAPFSYRLTSLGVFGPPHQPRVVWMGIEESSGSLQRLHRALGRELRQRRFELDRRPFAPHLTLARIRTPLNPNDLQQLQAMMRDDYFSPGFTSVYPVKNLAVMKSELLRGGAQYTCLQTYMLQRASGK